MDAIVSPYREVFENSMSLRMDRNAESTIRSSLTNIALPYFSCRRSIASVIPGTGGRMLLVPRCVFWMHWISNLSSLQKLASSSSFVEDSRSMFADTAIRPSLPA